MENKAEQIAHLVLRQFRSLGKKGKPTGNQWTTLAGFVIEEGKTFSVASLATGTKCVTGRPSQVENVLIDCHAEIIARRGLKRYLMARYEDNNQRNENFVIHFFISQLPCGTIDRYQGTSRKGAVQGVRRKPGRGEPCIEPSCVDKLLKWSILGVQGKLLLSITKKPLFISMLVIGNCVETIEYDETLLRSALSLELNDDNFPHNLFQRGQLPYLATVFVEEFRAPEFIKTDLLNVCPSAIVFWKEISDSLCEVIVDGLRQGLTHKTNDKNSLKISRKGLLSRFLGFKSNKYPIDESLIDHYRIAWESLKKIPRFMGWKTSGDKGENSSEREKELPDKKKVKTFHQ
ncbi:adenosine deaminase, tRNA-specific 1 [Brevipalpus obovatus]|uniref:adenosine deaminase, tRNA-specific 1 n=1 Tax=Brevipalpus obovatus TaxID=246614 RepID=UPI003D9DD690